MRKTKVSRPKRHSNGQLTYGRWYISDWMASATVLGLSDAGYRLFHLVCLRVMERGPLPDSADVVRAICPGVRGFDAAWSEVRPLLAASPDGRIFQTRALAEHEHGVAVCVQAADAVAEREAKRDTSSDESSDASEVTSTDPSTQDPRPKKRQQTQNGAPPLAPTAAASPPKHPATPVPGHSPDPQPPPTASARCGVQRDGSAVETATPGGTSAPLFASVGSGADAPSVKPRAKRAPSGPVQELLAWFQGRYESTQGTPYQIARKDAVAVTKALQAFPDAELRARLERGLVADDEWLAQTDRNLALLLGQINKPALRGIAPQTNGHHRTSLDLTRDAFREFARREGMLDDLNGHQTTNPREMIG